MIDPKLLAYIRGSLQQGVSQEQIKSALITNGWSESDVDAAFNSLTNQSPSTPQIATSTSLLKASEILGQAWGLYQQRLVTFLGIMLLPMLVLCGSVALVVGGAVFYRTNIFVSQSITEVAPFLGLIAAVVLVNIVSQSWANVALLYAIKDSRENLGIIKAYSQAWNKIIPYWWVAFLGGIITLGGFIAFVIPGILFALWFSFASIVLVVEDLRGMDALRKSREYVTGRVWALLGRLLFVGVVAWIISMVTSLAFGFSRIPFSFVISPLISGLFVLPFIRVYLFFVYENFKNLKQTAP